jgi:phage baseplate assembly protein W
MSILKITPLTKRISLYADFAKDMRINPVSNDVGLLIDEASIKESLSNLLMTDRGERLFQPTLGSDIRSTLFENNTPATLRILKEQVKQTINSNEPRITLIDVEVTSSYDENTIEVKILFYLRNREKAISVSVFLERAR